MLTKKVLSTFLVLFLLLMNQSALAEINKFSLVLYSGNVALIDAHSLKYIPGIGTLFSFSDFQKIELEKESQIYLQYNDKMIHINRPGVYEIAGLLEKKQSILSNALSFLEQLVSPRTFVSQKIARGKPLTLDQKESDEVYFESLWQDIAGEPESHISQIHPQNLIACAAWFQKQQQPARVAYILERLDGATGQKVPLFQKMRNDSFRGITLVKINREVEKTRRQVGLNLSGLDYKALLIGIDQYDHPEWQNLKNPVHDVQAIKELLIKDYYFQPDSVITLKNANFEEIINSFNALKSIVNENTNLLIYYAGHGFYPEDEGEGYWIPKDAGNLSTQKMFIPTSIVLSKIKAIPARHTLLVADSCFSGSLVRKTRGVIGQSKYYRELVKKRSRQIITSGGLEPVNDLGGSNHSIFAAKLIQFLKNDFKDPLSASELALNLRKEIKNSGEQQTPEYGRLNTLDDENGEFFFVKRGQTVLPEPEEKQTNALNGASGQALEETENEKEPWLDLGFFSFKFKDNDGIDRDPNVSAFQSYGSEDWVGIGLDIKLFTVKYEKFDQAESDWGKSSTVITGFGAKNEFRFSNGGLGYGVNFYLGGIYSANDESSSNKDDIDQEDKEARISGNYAGSGFFLDHTIVFIGGFSLQLGGAIEYHYLSADDVLNEANVTAGMISGCINLNTPYRFKSVTVQPYFYHCPYVVQTSGNLEDVSNNEVRDAMVSSINSIGALASFNF